MSNKAEKVVELLRCTNVLPQWYRPGFFESDATATALGRDIILYAVRKQRGQVKELGREGALPWCEHR